ncbi:isoprenyl transferase [Anaerotignum propionicum]|uniref:Isoprenyl transferase n=1 Tax=Anaerotignum propionicum DSM 1682 TaxID=991789 RepID=A0A0X1U890_ANAPI|nr:isoprenyl transferase [Anaerotignum propionicum]AMJ41157.1 ditrans,polycis-undecaprenyl-diphosphate synthase ((2E,6E)-farnesyl-diphosphate specific) [Anaerotignum propionicum DSM 1682]MEA5057639.1 isoprenyl transferase [Anaerotignum propionicum]SHE64847.1 undecaprenyl diphosphate synthase [[Clostridium] propionicum DSM 1682] [Anaerotignum propionicum DSM 1682]
MFFQKKEKAVSIDMTRLPKHIAIIMDGNGRWAAKRALPRKAGHKAGAEAFERLITDAKDLGIQHITVYAFSTENWKRSDEEVNAIMDLMRHYLKNSFQRFLKDNVRMHIIGDISRLDKDIQEQIQEVEEKSREKDGMTVHIALNYGGRDELLRSVQKITEKALNGQISLPDITEETIEENLDTAGIPDPELLIRTSGEERISNFLLWQIAYSEFYFSDVLWPDFNKKDLLEAIYYYQNRERRFGGR